ISMRRPTAFLVGPLLGLVQYCSNVKPCAEIGGGIKILGVNPGLTNTGGRYVVCSMIYSQGAIDPRHSRSPGPSSLFQNNELPYRQSTRYMSSIRKSRSD